MSKNMVPWRIASNNAFSRGVDGGASRQHVDLRLASAARMRAKGIHEAICRAFEKTGLLVTMENYALLPQAQRDEWNAAIEVAKAELAAEVVKT
jgi:hypothetical protein